MILLFSILFTIMLYLYRCDLGPLQLAWPSQFSIQYSNLSHNLADPEDLFGNTHSYFLLG